MTEPEGMMDQSPKAWSGVLRLIEADQPPAVTRSAKIFFEALDENGQRPNAVDRSPEGGLSFSFGRRERYAAVEFGGRGSRAVLVLSIKGQPPVIEVKRNSHKVLREYAQRLADYFATEAAPAVAPSADGAE